MNPSTAPLPVDAVLPEILAALTSCDEVVLAAPPGAGKTTRVPLALLEAGLLEGRILLLEPRRMAAKAVASRMAQLLGERLGNTVGLRIRQETQVGPKSRIEVITGGVFNRMLLDDPSLSGVSLVIFDEFHERSLDTDLGLALTLHGRSLFRDSNHPLKLLVMSATLETQRIAEYLPTARLVQSAGRQYPVTVEHRPGPGQGDWLVHARDQILHALSRHSGNLLVFLPGQKEIFTLRRLLEPDIERSVCLTVLYGGLNLAEQQRALEPLDPLSGLTRKIVLATDIAETSLTIEGVTVVIDSGYRRSPVFAVRNGMTRLATQRISQASATQRSGRAGRLAPGHCYRLWPGSLVLEPFSPPEILQADLAPLALQLLAFGVQYPQELEWLTLPPQAAFDQAMDLLEALGAVKRDAGVPRLSPHGQAMAEFPAHPRLAHMMIRGARAGLVRQACLLASLLGEPNRPRRDSVDLEPLVVDLIAGRPGWDERVRRQARSFEALLRKQPLEDVVPEDSAVGYLIALAYPERVAQRRGGESGLFRMSLGRAARLNRDDPLVNAEWIAIADLGGEVHQSEDRIYAASRFNPDLFNTHLAASVTTQDIAIWDEDKDRFVAQRLSHYGSLLLKSQATQLPPERRQQAVAGYVQKAGLGCLNWSDWERQWCARVILLRNSRTCREAEGQVWPDVSEPALLARLGDWLMPALANVQNRSDLKRIQLRPLLESLLPWPLPQRLNEWAPTHITAPSGSSVQLDYSRNPPVMAIKLQEMFGLQHTPTIARGEVAILIHLMSPGGQPLQITQDLTTFWRHGYPQVQKEMKGRYPRHPWPDDPLSAEPTRMTKKQWARSKEE